MVNITIRDVPPHVRDELARRARMRGQSTQEFLWHLLSSTTERSDKAELLRTAERRVAAMPPVDLEPLLTRTDDGRY